MQVQTSHHLRSSGKSNSALLLVHKQNHLFKQS